MIYKCLLVQIKSSSAAVLAASSDRLGPHGSVQVSFQIKSWSAAVLAARFIVQIHSSNSFFWAGFISCVIVCFKKLYCLFMDGVHLPQSYRATRGGTLLFTTKLRSILSFPKRLLPAIFQFALIDSKFWKILLSSLYVEHKWLFKEGVGYAPP